MFLKEKEYFNVLPGKFNESRSANKFHRLRENYKRQCFSILWRVVLEQFEERCTRNSLSSPWAKMLVFLICMYKFLI